MRRSSGTWRQMKLSVLVPLFNEEESVATLLERVIAAPLPPGLDREIIVADDGSTDSSVEEVERVAAKYPEVITLLKSERNQGKGAALRRAIAAAAVEFAIVQDAAGLGAQGEYVAGAGEVAGAAERVDGGE